MAAWKANVQFQNFPPVFFYIYRAKYSNTSQTRGSKLAKFSNSRFLSLLFTSKLAVPLCSTQIRDIGNFLSPKNPEFRDITVVLFPQNGSVKKYKIKIWVLKISIMYETQFYYFFIMFFAALVDFTN